MAETSYGHNASIVVLFVTPKTRRLGLYDSYDSANRKAGLQGRKLTIEVEGGSREECEAALVAVIDSLRAELLEARATLQAVSPGGERD